MVTTTTTTTKGYKVTLYSDWHRATALYTIYKNSLNGNYRYIQGCRTSRFCSSRQNPEIEGQTGRGRKSWSRSSKSRSRLFETILGVRLWSDRFFVMPIWCRRDRNRSTERHLVIPSATLSAVDIFSRPIFPELTQSRTKWYGTSICFEALWWTGFFDKATTPWMSL